MQQEKPPLAGAATSEGDAQSGQGEISKHLPSGHLSTRVVETATLLLPICSGDLV
jgi:hypothetical protein